MSIYKNSIKPYSRIQKPFEKFSVILPVFWTLAKFIDSTYMMKYGIVACNNIL